MTAPDERLAGERLAGAARHALESAAQELRLDPLTLARRLQEGEIARLVILLNAAQQHVDHKGLRRRIEDLLGAITDGRMPSESAESELDWALKVTQQRRAEQERRGDRQRRAADRGEEAG